MKKKPDSKIIFRFNAVCEYLDDLQEILSEMRLRKPIRKVLNEELKALDRRYRWYANRYEIDED